MAILTEELQNLFKQWASDAPEQTRAFIAKVAAEYPAPTLEESMNRFVADNPEVWLSLTTQLHARYSATQADVERAVGRVALSRADSSTILAKANLNPMKFANKAAPSVTELTAAATSYAGQNAEIERLKAELRAARTEQSGQSYSDGVEHAKKLQRLADWRTSVYVALFNEWTRAHANIGDPSDAGVRRVANLIADKTFDTPLYVEGNASRIIPIVNRARHLDDTPNRFEPTMTAFDLILEASGIQPATQG